MTLGDVTRASVLAAVEEFGRIGRDAFLKSIGFGPALVYFLQYDGKLCDSKAIIGYAHGVSNGVPQLPSDDPSHQAMAEMQPDISGKGRGLWTAMVTTASL